jgi:hypothetical protein
LNRTEVYRDIAEIALKQAKAYEKEGRLGNR